MIRPPMTMSESQTRTCELSQKVALPAGVEAAAEERALALFHPAVRAWFQRRFPHGPTHAQTQGWPAIAAGRDTLIAAPTGSGKTLSAFLLCIDRLYRAAERGELVDGAVDVVYVSPLKALVVDIRQNLQEPLEQIAEVARARVGARRADQAPAASPDHHARVAVPDGNGG
jgi:ATP-dependent helicase YprA (DUF1998 family)